MSYTRLHTLEESFSKECVWAVDGPETDVGRLLDAVVLWHHDWLGGPGGLIEVHGIGFREHLSRRIMNRLMLESVIKTMLTSFIHSSSVLGGI